jgi:hypothetical protein
MSVVDRIADIRHRDGRDEHDICIVPGLTDIDH